MSDSASFRQHLDRDEIIVCPGAHDPLTARVLDHVGFDVIHMTGYGSTLSRSGYPDVGLVTMPEMTDNARKIASQVDVPVFCDADDGYGDVKNVIRTVEEFIHTGVAGVHIEDQTSPKRGIIGGHEVIPEDRFLGKIRAACDVRDDIDREFVIAARSDAPGATNASLDDAISRLNAAVEVGADLAFVIGQSTEEEVRRVGEAVDAPLVYDWNGYHPRVDLETLHGYGYELVVCSLIATRATMLGVYDWARRLEEDGLSVTDELLDGFDERDLDVDELAGFSTVLEWEETYLDGSGE